MHSHDSVNSVITAKVMDRMRSLGSLTIAKNEDRAQQIVRLLDFSDVSPEDVSDGFFQLVDEGKIRSSEFNFPLGDGGSTVPQPVYERQILYSLAE